MVGHSTSNLLLNWHALEAVSIGLVVPVVGTIVEPSFITTLPIFGLFLDDLPFSKDYGLQVFKPRVVDGICG